MAHSHPHSTKPFVVLNILVMLFPAWISAAEIADLVLKNATVYTVNDKQPRAEAIAIKGARIIYVGRAADVTAYEGPNTKILDLNGAIIVPGLTDSHCHLSGVGARELNLNLEAVTGLDDLLSSVQERTQQTKSRDWVTGRGWIETFWNPPTFPTRWDLDKVSPNHPVYLTRADGHGAVANSAAIRVAGVDKSTPAPFGGEITKDRNSGEPNGMFLDNAQSLITRHIPPATREERERALSLGAKRSLELGWTQVHIAGNSWDEVQMIEKLYRDRKLKLRIYNAVQGPGDHSTQLLRRGHIIGAFDQRFTCRGIKVSFDGALGSKGAALLEKYSDYDSAGFLKWKEQDLLPMFEQALRQGAQVWVHAIGDRANRETLNLFERALHNVPPDQRRVKEPRWRIEHAQIVNAADLPRFALLGVIPSMQPSHAIGDLHFAVSRLGLKRLDGAYAWQSFLRSGCIIAGGSDAPVERGEPMIEFYAAVARRDMKGFQGKGWHPEQAVSREHALKMFTLWPAHAAFEEDSRGSIEPGKLADLTVLSQDIMKVPEAEILKTRCLLTVVNGEPVYTARP